LSAVADGVTDFRNFFLSQAVKLQIYKWRQNANCQLIYRMTQQNQTTGRTTGVTVS
jgi:hypothetical protein